MERWKVRESANRDPLTFGVIFQQQVEVAQLAEDLRLHFALSLEDERVVAADSLERGREQESKREIRHLFREAGAFLFPIISEYWFFFQHLLTFVHPTAVQ